MRSLGAPTRRKRPGDFAAGNPRKPAAPRGSGVVALLRRLDRSPGFVGALGNFFFCGFLAASVVHSLSLGGRLAEAGSFREAALDNVAGFMGLSVRDVTVDGLKNVPKERALAAIGVREGSSLIGFDAAGARAKLTELDWVVEASVLRLFPNRLHVELRERRPYALWQENGRFFVIDESGRAVRRIDPARWSHLPTVVGKGAQEAAAELVNQLAVHPSLKLLVREAVRVADRRWTLHLANDVKVLLPAEDVPGALRRLVGVEREHDILSRDIVSVDLRLSDRISLRLSEKAAERRRTEKNGS